MTSKAALLSDEESKDLVQSLERKHASSLEERYFLLEVRDDDDGVYATVTLRDETGQFVYPIESRIAHGGHDKSKKEAIFFLVDYIDSYLEEYFTHKGEVYLPIDWADYEWEDIPLQLRGQIRNLQYEKMADELLARGGEPAETTLH